MTDLAALVVRMQADNSQYIKALDQATTRLTRFQKEQHDALKDLGTKIVEAFAIEKVVEFGMKAIESAAWLEKFSESTGISTEALSSLKLTAAAAGMNLEEMGVTFKKLNVSMADAAGNEGSKAGVIFGALGISVKDASGHMKDAGVVLGELADKFKDMADGPNKVAIAVALMGKRGQEMIPILNDGSEGMKKMKEEAEKAGLVISGPMAMAAENLSRRMNVLKAEMVDGLSVQLALKLIPAINNVMDAFTKSGDAMGKFGAIAEVVVTGVRLIASAVSITVTQFHSLGDSIGNLAARAVALAHLNFKEASDIFKEGVASNIAIQKAGDAQLEAIWKNTSQTELDLLKKTQDEKKKNEGPNVAAIEAAAKALDSLKKFRDSLQEQAAAFGLGEAAAVRYKLQIGALAEDLKKTGDAGRKIADEAIKFADALQFEKDTKSVTEYTDKLNEQVITFNMGHMAAEEYKLANGKLGEELFRMGEAGKVAKDKLRDLAQLSLDQKNQSAITQLDDQTLRLTGHLNQAALAAFDLQHRALKEDLSAPTNNAEQAAANAIAVQKLELQRHEVDLQSQLNELQQKASVINADLAATESKISLQHAQGLIGDIEASNQSEAARSKAVEQLNEILAAEKGIAAATNDPAIVDGVKRFGVSVEQLQVQMTQFEQSVRSGLEGAFAHNFADLITGAKTFKQAILGFLQDIDRQFADMIAKDYAQKLFGAASGTSSGGALGGLPGLIANLFGAGSGAGSGIASTGAAAVGTDTGALASTIGAFAEGGTISAGKIAVVGERGPELVHTGPAGAPPMMQPDVRLVGVSGPEIIYAGPKDLQIVPNAESKSEIAQHLAQQQPIVQIAQIAAANDMSYSAPAGTEKAPALAVTDSTLREREVAYMPPQLQPRTISIAGAFETGGVIPAGEVGIVGENGPELAYSGARDMTIVPKAAHEDRSVIVNNHFTIHSANGTISRSSQMQVAAAAARSLGQANARNNR